MVRAGRVVLLLVRWTWLFLFWPMHQDVVGASFLHLISISFQRRGTEHIIGLTHLSMYDHPIAWTVHALGA